MGPKSPVPVAQRWRLELRTIVARALLQRTWPFLGSLLRPIDRVHGTRFSALVALHRGTHPQKGPCLISIRFFPLSLSFAFSFLFLFFFFSIYFSFSFSFHISLSLSLTPSLSLSKRMRRCPWMHLEKALFGAQRIFVMTRVPPCVPVENNWSFVSQEFHLYV